MTSSIQLNDANGIRQLLLLLTLLMLLLLLLQTLLLLHLKKISIKVKKRTDYASQINDFSVFHCT